MNILTPEQLLSYFICINDAFEKRLTQVTRMARVMTKMVTVDNQLSEILLKVLPGIHDQIVIDHLLEIAKSHDVIREEISEAALGMSAGDRELANVVLEIMGELHK